MPIYEYRCEECGALFEKFVRSMTGTPDVKCPECGSDKVHKGISTFASRGAGSTQSATSSTDCGPSL